MLIFTSWGTRAKALEQTEVVGILGLQRADERFELGVAAEIFEARIACEERPAGESVGDGAFEPFECRGGFAENGENAGDLIVGVVFVSKGFWTDAGARKTFASLGGVAGYGVEQAEQRDE